MEVLNLLLWKWRRRKAWSAVPLLAPPRLAVALPELPCPAALMAAGAVTA